MARLAFYLRLSFLFTVTSAFICDLAGAQQADTQRNKNIFYQLANHGNFAEIIPLALGKAEASDLQSKQAIWLQNAGRAAIRLGAYQTAALYLQMALNVEPASVNGQSLLAYTYLLQEDWQHYRSLIDNSRVQDVPWRLLEVTETSRRHASQALAELKVLGKQSMELTTEVDIYRTTPRKSPVVAGLLGLVPGGGFVYLGMYQSAAISILLTGLTGWAAWELFERGLPASASGVAALSSVFYVGGIFSAARSASDRNDKFTATSRDKIREIAFPALQFVWSF